MYFITGRANCLTCCFIFCNIFIIGPQVKSLPKMYQLEPHKRNPLILMVRKNDSYNQKGENHMARVFIGVGHGGKDPGAVANGLKESNVNLVMALAMKEKLEEYGVSVGISRTVEEDDPLTQEIVEANTFQADLAVEVHNNAGGGKGFEVYRQTGKFAQASTHLAQEIERAVKEMGQSSRGVKTKLNSTGADWFGWLRQVNCPAVLCEGAFLDNTQDVQLINTVEKQRAFGVAYAKGVLNYLGIPLDSPVTPPEKTVTIEQLVALLQRDNIPYDLESFASLLRTKYGITAITL